MIQALLPLIGSVLDKVIPDEKAKADAKLALLELQMKGELASLEIIKEEAKSEHILTATWRPIVMLTFCGLIVARWFGWAAPELSETEYLKLWDIVELGLGGYAIGRSFEKSAPHLAKIGKK